MAQKHTKRPSTRFTSSFVNTARRKKQQKIVFGILTVILGLGLVGSSMFWAFGGKGDLPTDPRAADVQPEPTLEEKIAELEAQLKEDPQSYRLMLELAGLYRDGGKFQMAVDTYLKAMKINSEDANLRKDLASTYFLMGEYDQAVNRVEEVLKQKPDDAEAHYLLGQFYAYRSDDGRDVERGIRELEEFVRLQKTGLHVDKARQYIEELKANRVN